MWRVVALALPLAVTAAAPAVAQDRAGARDDHREPWEVEPTTAFIEVDVQSTADDRRDHWAIRDIERQWREALRFDDPLAERIANQRLMQWIEDELAEDQFEVDAEERELAEVRANGAVHRVRVERMERTRAVADLAETQRAYERLQGLRLAFEEGRATDAHYRAMADLIADLVRRAEEEVSVSVEEERQDREAYLDTLRRDRFDWPV